MIIHDVVQGSPDWYALRAGLPTASEFSKVVTSKGDPSKQAEAYAMRLAAELHAGHPMESFEGNAWTERGKELEESALAYYAFMRDMNTQVVGFVTDDEKRWGASPDRLVGDDGLAEMKCLKPENHVKVMSFFKRNGKAPSEYYAQPQGQMFVTGRAWCDLIFYCPDLPPVIIRQDKNAEFHEKLEAGLNELLKSRDEALSLIQEFDEAEKAA